MEWTLTCFKIYSSRLAQIPWRTIAKGFGLGLFPDVDPRYNDTIWSIQVNFELASKNEIRSLSDVSIFMYARDKYRFYHMYRSD